MKLSGILKDSQGREYNCIITPKEIPPEPPERIFLNEGRLNALDLSSLNFKYNIRRLTSGAFRFPYIKGDTELIFGGIPQRWIENPDFINIHKEQIKRQLPNYGVNAEYSGYLIVNWEKWYPYWEDKIKPSTKYRHASYDWVREKNPALQDSVVKILAKQTWIRDSIIALILTLNYIKILRPNAKIGIYRYPERYYFPAGPDYPEEQKIANSRLGDIWNKVDLLIPSIYQFYPNRMENADYVAKNVIEAVRLNKEFNTTAKILPYFWERYHPGTREDPYFLTFQDMEITHDIALNFGADGLIWFTSEKFQSEEIFCKYRKYIEEVMIPIWGG